MESSPIQTLSVVTPTRDNMVKILKIMLFIILYFHHWVQTCLFQSVPSPNFWEPIVLSQIFFIVLLRLPHRSLCSSSEVLDRYSGGTGFKSQPEIPAILPEVLPWFPRSQTNSEEMLLGLLNEGGCTITRNITSAYKIFVGIHEPLSHDERSTSKRVGEK